MNFDQIEDARAAMLLYQRNKKEWEKSIRDQMRLRQKQNKRNQKGKTNEGGALDVNRVAIISQHSLPVDGSANIFEMCMYKFEIHFKVVQHASLQIVKEDEAAGTIISKNQLLY